VLLVCSDWRMGEIWLHILGFAQKHNDKNNYVHREVEKMKAEHETWGENNRGKSEMIVAS